MHYLAQGAGISVANMAFIGTRMNRDALGTEFLNPNGRVEHIGYIPSPCIAQGGYFINVDAQTGGLRCHIREFGPKFGHPG